MKLCKHDCCNAAAPGRNECYKCRSRLITERKPIDCVFYWLRKSAKKRHLEFSITLAWFREFVKGNGYMEGRGRLTDSLTIDRVDNLRGYTMDNLQILSKSENVIKYHATDVKRELGPQWEEEILPF